MTFPAWAAAVGVAAVAVWGVAQLDTRAAWLVAIVVVLGVLVARPDGMLNFQALITEMMGRPVASRSTDRQQTGPGGAITEF